MPQLDHIIIFPQIFWLFSFFIFFYIILVHFFLPNFLKSLKARKLIQKINTEKASFSVKKSSESKTKLTNIAFKNLNNVKEILNSDSNLSLSNFNSVKTNEIDKAIGVIAKNSILFCNYQILDSINTYFKLIKK